MDDLCILIQEVEEYFDNNPDHFITDQFMTFRQNLNNDCAMLNGVITTLTNFAKNTPFRQRRLLRSQRTNQEILKEELGLMPPRSPLFPGGWEYRKAAADFETLITNDEENVLNA